MNLSFLRRFSKSAGPGVITGVADDDPSGIATYAQTGAMFGYTQLWLVLFSFPFMVAIQEMCGRIGMVTGKGLAGVAKIHYSKKVLYGAVFILALANCINIGADVGAMASAVELILPIPFGISVLILTVITVLAQILIPYKDYVTFLKYLALSVFAYIISSFMVNQDWSMVFTSLVTPHISFDRAYLLNVVAMLGTTISPYLFFWQASEEVEEEVAHGKLKEVGTGTPTLKKNDLSQMRIDTITGMFISNLVTFFIIITAVQTLGVNGITEITSAAQMAEALRPLAGDASALLFTLAIIGTGMLAVPVLAGSAAYALAEAFGWKAGLGKSFKEAKAFYITIACIISIGALVPFLPINPILLLYYAAALNGVLAPPLMFMILRIANDKRVLGNHVNSRLSNVLGYTIAILMSVSSLLLVGTYLV